VSRRWRRWTSGERGKNALGGRERFGRGGYGVGDEFGLKMGVVIRRGTKDGAMGVSRSGGRPLAMVDVSIARKRMQRMTDWVERGVGVFASRPGCAALALLPGRDSWACGAGWREWRRSTQLRESRAVRASFAKRHVRYRRGRDVGMLVGERISREDWLG